MSAQLDHTYAYRRASTCERGTLHLATSTAATAPQPFVRATVPEPRRVAIAMRLVSDIVRSRHHIPAQMLARILRESDPVLTYGDGVLRVEGFSSCCGIYARADIEERALDAQRLRHGTTNVEFNAAMRGALAHVRDGDALALEVGDDGVKVNDVIERKVALPLRWIRGFGEVQAIQRRMTRAFELSRVPALRFLRSLPRSGRPSDAAYVVPTGRSARLGFERRSGAVRVAGLSRLRALEPGLSLMQRLVVYEDRATGASAWQLAGDAVSLTTVLSPEVWRGFSGEGQQLMRLAKADSDIAAVRAELSWQSSIVADDDAMDDALAVLATRGLVGFDVARGAWFHRELPFDLESALERQHPRLKGARKLMEQGAVTIVGRDDERGDIDGEVRSQGMVHRVSISPVKAACTCTWYAKHQGTRGPCKHVIAVELIR